MQVHVRLFAAFREAVGRNALMIDAPPGSTAGQIVEQLRAEHPSLGPAIERAMLALNQEYVEPSASVSDGGELALIPPVSGG